jgi:hypothetical protein
MNAVGSILKAMAMCAAAVLILAGSACHSTVSEDVPTPPASIPNSFSNASWAATLTAIVTPDGYVNWNALQSNDNGARTSLLAYIGLINAVSPVNHPELFPTADDRFAYWINAYNAMSVYAVVEHHYPTTMLDGVPAGGILSVEQFTFGGDAMSLEDLVHNKIQPFGDPRVFFALNFCAASCPPLRSSPYDGAVLDAELMDQGQRYLSDPRAAVRDGDAVKLNTLLTGKHAYDFLAGYKKLLGVAPANLLQALQPFVQSDSPLVGATKVEDLGFDWTLNRPPRG